MLLEYLQNMYVLPLIATIVGLTLVYIYDKFEKKQYTNAVYFRLALLIYLSCLATIYISRLQFLQVGGGFGNPAEAVQEASEYSKQYLEQFKTGVPTF